MLTPKKATLVILALLALAVASPYMAGTLGILGLDFGNYAARAFVFADAWSRGGPLPEVTAWTGCGEPYVLFNGSLASCAAGAASSVLSSSDAWSIEEAVAVSVRWSFVLYDALSVLLMFFALRLGGLGRTGALVGAAAWGFGWLRRGESIHAANLEHAAFLALLPLAAGLVARIVRRPEGLQRPVAGLALLLAFMVPVHPGLAVIFGVQLGLAVVLALLLAPHLRETRITSAKALGGAALLGAVITAWFAGPLLAERAAFGQTPFVVLPREGASLLDYFDRSLWFSQTDTPALSPNNYMSSAYAGLALLPLVGCGIGLPGARKRTAVVLAIGCGSALVSLHPDWTDALFGPIYGLASIRFAAPAFFWLLIGAALGADSLGRWVAAQDWQVSRGMRAVGLAALLVGIVGADFQSLERARDPLYAPKNNPTHPLCVGPAIQLEPLWLEAGRLSAEAGPADRLLEVPKYEQHQGIAIHGIPLVDGLERHGWRAGFKSELERLRLGIEAAAMGVAVPDAIAPADLPAALDAFGVRFVTLVNPRLPTNLPGLEQVARSEQAALYQRTVGIRGAYMPEGKAYVREGTDASLRVAVESQTGGWLRVSRQFHSRWRARILDRKLNVRESQHGWIEVEVPGGVHDVELKLAPWVGRPVVQALTLAGLLVALLALCFPVNLLDLVSRLKRKPVYWLAAGAVLLGCVRLLWVPLEYVRVTMDEGRYLGLAKSFPWHTLYGDGQLYLFHPPLYSWLIGVLSLLLPDHVAGLTVSTAAAGATCVFAWKLARVLGYPPLVRALTAIVLLCLAVFVANGHAIMKESLYVLLITAYTWAVVRELRHETRRLLWPALLGVALVLTGDSSVLAFGVLVVCALWRPAKTDQKFLVGAGACLVLPWVVWAGVRAFSYGAADHLPASVDGMIVDTTSFNLKQLYSPYFFPEYSDIVSRGERPLALRFRAFTQLLEIQAGAWRLSWAWSLLFLGPAAVRSVRRGRARENPELFLLAVALLLSVPTVLHEAFLPRFGSAAAVPLAILIASGVHACLRTLRAPPKVLAGGLAVCVVLAGCYLGLNDPGPRPFWSLEKKVESQKAAEVLKRLPGKGVMAQLGYGQELAYLLDDKTVVALPFFPDRLQEFIEAYEIDYIVCGDHYFVPLDEGPMQEIWCQPSLAEVFQNRARFEHLTTVSDDSIPDWPDKVRIFRVLR